MNTEQRQYGSLREKIAAEKAERADRYARFAEVAREAEAAGRAAAEACTPRPMVVVDEGRGYAYPPVMDGVCGFAWVHLAKGNTSFAHWAKKNLGARKSYYGGLDIWVDGYGQSYERKLAHARAYGQVISDRLGVSAYGTGRLD